MEQMPKGIAGQNSVKEKRVIIGEITGVHGIKGYLKIRPFTESYDLFSPGIRVFMGTPDKSGAPDKVGEWYEIVRATPHKKGIIALFQGVTMEIAQTLVGQKIAVAKSLLPELDPDTYYWEDLVGLRVTDIHSGYLGVITYVMPTGSNDVFVVNGKLGEVLIPALSWVVLSVDLDNGEMTVDLPDGLRN